MPGILIGVDGSDGAAQALRWAAREADLRDWDLTALLAWGYLSQHHVDPEAGFDPDYTSQDADDALAAYVERALGAECAARVIRRTECELPAAALLDPASEPDLLVVGARGLSTFKGALLGSVSQRCLSHANGPIAIVPDTGDPEASARVVVGIDGSETSRRALRWAVEEARLRGGSLKVVHAWHLPYVGGYPYAASTYDAAPFEDAARRTLDGVVEGIDASGLAAPPERILHLGDPAAALLDAARGAAMVVVGSRGLGGFTGLLLGSVGHHVAHHAPCPVVVVPPAS